MLRLVRLVGSRLELLSGWFGFGVGSAVDLGLVSGWFRVGNGVEGPRASKSLEVSGILSQGAGRIQKVEPPILDSKTHVA